MTSLASAPGLRPLLPEELLKSFAKDPLLRVVTRDRDLRIKADPFELRGDALWFYPYSVPPVPIAYWHKATLYVRDLPADAYFLGWQQWTPQDALGRLESYQPTLRRVPGPLTPLRMLTTMFQSLAFAGAGPLPTAGSPAWGTLEWNAFQAWWRLKVLWRRWFGGRS